MPAISPKTQGMAGWQKKALSLIKTCGYYGLCVVDACMDGWMGELGVDGGTDGWFSCWLDAFI